MKNFYGWAISQKLPINGLKWVEDLSKFNEDFIKSYNEKCNEGFFLEVDVNFLKVYMNFIMIYHFCPK